MITGQSWCPWIIQLVSISLQFSHINTPNQLHYPIPSPPSLSIIHPTNSSTDTRKTPCYNYHNNMPPQRRMDWFHNNPLFIDSTPSSIQFPFHIANNSLIPTHFHLSSSTIHPNHPPSQSPTLLPSSSTHHCHPQHLHPQSWFDHYTRIMTWALTNVRHGITT